MSAANHQQKSKVEHPYTPRCMHFSRCCLQKGMPMDKATLNSEEIKLVASAIKFTIASVQ